MRSICTLSLLAAFLIGSPVFAAETQSAPSSATQPAAMSSSTKFEASVVSVNLKKRLVTLRSADGETLELLAGEEARNLEQLRAGDLVAAEYTEAIAMQLKKVKAEAHTTAGAMVGRTPKGKKPGALFEREVSFVADIIAVNAATKIVTVKGAGGRIVDITVNDPAKLAAAKVGDQVEGVFVQALSITVKAEAAKKAPAKK